MLDVTLASIINCADLVKVDMLDSTYKNISINKPGIVYEKNTLAAYSFSAIGYENTYILTVSGIAAGAFILYKIDPTFSYWTVKALSLIEFYYASKNDIHLRSKGCKTTAISAEFSVFEFTF